MALRRARRRTRRSACRSSDRRAAPAASAAAAVPATAAAAARHRAGSAGSRRRRRRRDRRAARSRKSVPPPHSQSGLPDSAAFSARTCRAPSRTMVTPSRVPSGSVREYTYVGSGGAGRAAGRDEHLVGHAAHDEAADRGVHGGEVDVGIDRDPVELAVGSGDVAVEAGGDGVAELPHGKSSLGRWSRTRAWERPGVRARGAAREPCAACASG